MNRNERIVKEYQANTCAKELSVKYDLTERHIQRIVTLAGASRTRSESYILAIQQGRMKYAHKPEHLKVKRKTIGLKLRFEVLNRDNFKCVLCGRTAQQAHRIEIDHIDNDPSNNVINNLQTLCDLCNKGKAYNADR